MNNKSLQNDLISVVIPTYNRDYLIEKAINNTFEQTYKNIEVIVVDDGSNDNTENVIKNINDSRLRYIRLEHNQGMCAARNEGFKIARGDYLACQDTDVLWDKEKLEKQYKYMKQNNYDLIFCRVFRGFQDGKMHTVPTDNFKLEEDTFMQLLLGNFIDSPTIFMKKEVWNHVKFDPMIRRLTDWDFSIRVLKSGYIIGYQAESLVTSYIMKDSTSLNVNAHESYRIIYDKYKDDFDRTRKTQGQILRILATTIMEEDKKLAKKYFRMSLKSDFSWKSIFEITSTKMKINAKYIVKVIRGN